MRPDTLFLGPVLRVEPKHALDRLVAPIIIPALVARAGQLDPVLHGGGLEEQQFSARFLEADKVSQVHLQLYQLSHRLLVIRVTLEGEEVRSPGLIVLPIIAKKSLASMLVGNIDSEAGSCPTPAAGAERIGTVVLLTSLCGG